MHHKIQQGCFMRPDLLRLSRAKLKMRCKANKLSCEGSKSDMVHRLLHLYSKTSSSTTPAKPIATKETISHNQKQLFHNKKKKIDTHIKFHSINI